MLIFKISVTLLFICFIASISDFRNKQTNPLFSRPWLRLMKFGYLIPQLSCLYFVWKLDFLNVQILVCPVLMLVGLIIVLSAKRELGNRHSWAGYASVIPKDYCVTGVYAWVRHPLYLGIMVFVVGLGFIVIPNFMVQLQLACTYLIGNLITFLFLILSAHKETRYLAEKFGEPFLDYASQVYSFFPIRKYKPAQLNTPVPIEIEGGL